MQATKGFAVLFGSRTRLIGCSMAIALSLAALSFASTAHAATGKTYFALGDSLAFGYSQQLFNENLPKENPNKFENGFANDYLALLRTTSPGWRLTNDGCPGETSASMIGNGNLSKELAPLGATSEAPCAYKYVLKYKLHNNYGGKKSQLENALGVIKERSTSESPVTTISLEIGANDKLHQVAKCEAEVTKEFTEIAKGEKTLEESVWGSTPAEAFKNCVAINAFPTFKKILTNQSAILFAIRQGSQFCVEAETTPCDAAHKGVNFTGKVILGGAYDPYGRVFCAGETFANPGNAPASCVPGPEILEFSNALTAILNSQEETKVAPVFGACFANPQPVFNPVLLGEPQREPFQLQTLTNMDNKTISNGLANGDGLRNDIHPTPLGYQALGNGMSAACGL